MQRSLFLSALAALILLLSPSAIRAQETSDVQVMGTHDQFVLSMTEDRQGTVWVGTEDQSVWRLNLDAPGRPRWKQYTRLEGIGDDGIYALACDRQGRIWAGHLRSGVSVFDGQKWRNYPVGQGPLGERVFDIAVSPTDGDVWIATNCGLTRYSVKSDTWSHFTTSDGLPEQAARALAFNARGDLFVGTESHGLAIAAAAGGYRKWRFVSGELQLPSDLINDVLLTREGILYVATPSGLARSDDEGHTWRVLKGRDAAAKKTEHLRYLSPTAKTSAEEKDATPIVGTLAAASVSSQAADILPSIDTPLLEEDYVTCLAQDGAGRLWIGTRRHGFEVRDARSLRVMFSPANGSPWHAKEGERSQDEFVRCILPRAVGGPPLIGSYGQGVAPARNPSGLAFPASPLPLAVGVPRLPSPAAAPTQGELSELLRRLSQVAPLRPTAAPLVVALGDDWSTQGDWLGRYGRYQAVLGAIVSPRDYVWGAGEEAAPYDVRIGPHRTPDDSVRYWIQWLSTTSSETLEMPPTYYGSRVKQNWNTEGHRRQAEWDDHGEEYPMTLDGPHIYTSIQVPKGWFILSLYDFNKDGHRGNNRRRDYQLSVRARPAKFGLGTVEGFDEWPELARGRIHDFRGGVWKRYLVRGPQALTIEVNRNFSYNTVLAGLFLDRLEEQPAPYFGTIDQWRARQAVQEQQRSRLIAEWSDSAGRKNRVARFTPGKDAAESAQRLFAGLQEVRLINPAWHESEGRRYYLALLRWCRSKMEDEPIGLKPTVAKDGTSLENGSWLRECLKTCFYQLHLYPQWEEQQRRLGMRPARDIERALKWDGISNNSGRGNAVVKEYLQASSKPQPNLQQ